MAIFDDLPLDPILNHLFWLSLRDVVKLQFVSRKFKAHCHNFFARAVGSKNYDEGVRRLRALNKPLRQLVLDSTYTLAFAERISNLAYSREHLEETLRDLCAQGRINWIRSIEWGPDYLPLLKEGLVPLGSLIYILQNRLEGQKEYFLLKSIIERGLPSFRKLREILTFEQIITLPSINYYYHLEASEVCLNAIKNKWLLPEDFKKMDLALCTLILNHGYYNTALKALQKGLVNPALLAGIKSGTMIERNLHHLFWGNAFTAFEEGFIPFEEIIRNESESLLLRKLSREKGEKLLNLIRRGEINIAEAIQCETDEDLNGVLYPRTRFCLLI